MCNAVEHYTQAIFLDILLFIDTLMLHIFGNEQEDSLVHEQVSSEKHVQLNW